MIPRLKPILGWREAAAALQFPSRDDVASFERSFADKMGQAEAVAFPHGRTGLMILLEALGLKQQQIIMPAYTCVVVPHAAIYSGNKPVFIDSAPGDFNMDLEVAEAVITPDTGALIATSIFGYPVDLDRLGRIRDRFPDLKIIQDCAHSFNAEWRGRPVQQAGIAAIFGLNISKMMTSVFGGMITTDDPDLANRLRDLRQERLSPSTWLKGLKRLAYLGAVYPAFSEPVYGTINWLERSGLLNRFVKYYDDAVIDMPDDYLHALGPLEARVGKVQTARLNAILQNRREVATAWREKLAGVSGLTLPPHVDGCTYSHFVGLVENRTAWMQTWRKAGIQLGEIIEYCIPDMAAYHHDNAGDFPVARHYAARSINFPVWLSPDRVRELTVPQVQASMDTR